MWLANSISGGSAVHVKGDQLLQVWNGEIRYIHNMGLNTR